MLRTAAAIICLTLVSGCPDSTDGPLDVGAPPPSTDMGASDSTTPDAATADMGGAPTASPISACVVHGAAPSVPGWC